MPKFFAHRGAPAHAPENTLVSLEAAYGLGARWTEFDVQLTQDGMPIVLHDTTLDRTTNGQGPVAAMTWSELATLDAGGWYAPEFVGERVPTLDAWLMRSAELGMGVNIELKAPAGEPQALVDAVLASLARHWSDTLPPPLISSTDQATLVCYHQKVPDALLALIAERWQDVDQESLSVLPLFSVHLDVNQFERTQLQAIHQYGLRVLLYTVNKVQYAQVMDWGIDSCFLDDPTIVEKEAW